MNIADFIIIDKPLDAELVECERFVRNCRRSSTRVYVNFQRRFLPCWQSFKRAVEAERDGNFCYGEITVQSFYPNWRPNKPADVLYVARRELGGGVLLTECHEIDLIQWIFGDIQDVYASTEDTAPEQVENYAQMCFHVSFAYGKRPVMLTVDDMCDAEKRIARFRFQNATYEIDELAQRVVRITAAGPETIYAGGGESPNPHKTLLASLYDGDADVPTMEDGLNVNAVIQAAKESAANREVCVVKKTVCPKEGEPYLEMTIQKLQEAFGERLIAVYGLGSLGYDGYVPGWSDFDLDVLVDTGYEEAPEDYRIGKKIEKEVQNAGFERIDIRVYNPDHLNERKTILTYGQCSRALMLTDSSVLLYGRDVRHQIIRPTIPECNGEAIGLLKKMLANPETWWNQLPWDDIAAHYALVCRFHYTADEGRVAGKRVALEYFISHYAAQMTPEMLRWMLWALSCRLSYHPLFIQDTLHGDAVVCLQDLFRMTLHMLEEREL